MKINRIRAIAWKEILQIRRDLRSILIVVAMPVILMLAFGYGVSFDIKHLPTYVFRPRKQPAEPRPDSTLPLVGIFRRA